MPIVSDFVHILGDQTVKIGDGSNENGYTKQFGTGGRHRSGTAYITFMVKGMTVTEDHADVFVNDVKVGTLFNNKGGNKNHWQTQIVSLGGGQLNGGNNTLRVGTVPNPDSNTDDFDDFFIRNVICNFHQSA